MKTTRKHSRNDDTCTGSSDVIYLFIYYIIVHEVQNTHIQRKIGLKNIKSNHKITIHIVKQLVSTQKLLMSVHPQV